MLALATVAEFRTAMVLLFVTGFFAIVFVASCNTTLQLTTPDELRGRVMSLHALMFGGSFPIGSFVVGALAEAFGVRAALVAGGLSGLLGVGAILAWWRRRER
jgi:predicted MFS family arabinose efflux permease